MTHPAHLESELVAADAVGEVIEYWGFRKALGRVWTVLYLTGEPMAAGDVGERLSMSAGSVSTTLTELQRWGVVRRVWLPGERREFFVAETDLWKMITKVLRERERHLASEVKARLERARELLARAPQGAETRARKERLMHLLTLAGVGERVLDALVSSGILDFSAYRDVLAKVRPIAAARR